MTKFSRIVRNVLAPVFVVVPALLAACSSQGPEESSSSDQALMKCPAGSRVSCDTFDGPHGPLTACECDPYDFYTVASMPTAGSDTVGIIELPVPAALSSRGLQCTRGVRVDNQPIWACRTPTGAWAGLPPTLGMMSAEILPCERGWIDSWPTPEHHPFISPTAGPTTCEAVIGFTKSTSNCIGNAPPGWFFVIDSVWNEVSQGDGGSNGGCTGQCASPMPPATKVIIGTHG